VVDGAAAAAALADSGGQRGMTVRQRVAVASECQTRTHWRRRVKETGCHPSLFYIFPPHSLPPLISLPAVATGLDDNTTMGVMASGRGGQR
jgi:hypothetical protein